MMTRGYGRAQVAFGVVVALVAVAAVGLATHRGATSATQAATGRFTQQRDAEGHYTLEDTRTGVGVLVAKAVAHDSAEGQSARSGQTYVWLLVAEANGSDAAFGSNPLNFELEDRQGQIYQEQPAGSAPDGGNAQPLPPVELPAASPGHATHNIGWVSFLVHLDHGSATFALLWNESFGSWQPVCHVTVSGYNLAQLAA